MKVVTHLASLCTVFLKEWELVQTLGFHTRPMESIAFSPMKHTKQTTSVLVALGGLDSKVHLYASSASSLQVQSGGREIVRLVSSECLLYMLHAVVREVTARQAV